MSVRISSLVWEFSKHTASDLVMMLAIADFSSDDGRSYPSIATLARKARMSIRNARYVLDRLETSGELAIQLNGGPRGCNVYRVMIKPPLQAAAPLQPIAPLQAAAPLQQTSPTPAAGFPLPLQPIAPEPSLNRQEPLEARAKRTQPVSLKAFLEQCRSRKVVPIPADHPVYRLADQKHIPTTFVQLAWKEFKRRHLPGGANDGTRKANWGRHFQNAVDNRWHRLWWFQEDGTCVLTSDGQQANRMHEEQAA